MTKERDPVAVEMGRRLKEERERRELSQSELATRAGLKPAAIGNYEQGLRAIRLETAQALASALDMPAAYFMLELSRQEAEVIKTMRRS